MELFATCQEANAKLLLARYTSMFSYQCLKYNVPRQLFKIPLNDKPSLNNVKTHIGELGYRKKPFETFCVIGMEHFLPLLY